MYYYTIEEIDRIRSSATKVDLSKYATVVSTLTYLENEIKKNIVLEPPVEQHYNSTGGSKRSMMIHTVDNKRGQSHEEPKKERVQIIRRTVHNNNNNNNKSSSNKVTTEDWEALRNFKTTKIEVKEGLDKIINEKIRMVLNKIIVKNYESLKDTVLASIAECIDQYPEPITMEKVSKSIFDIVCNNRFLSEVYVDLYSTLVTKYDAFRTLLLERVQQYRDTMDQMKYADPDKDYDAYCAYVKSNDYRKAITLFIINMFKKGCIFDAEYMIELIQFLLAKTRENYTVCGRQNEVEEITENFYLIYSNCNYLLCDYPVWSNKIIPIIREYAELKPDESQSITSRVLFKYQDIVEGLE